MVYLRTVMHLSTMRYNGCRLHVPDHVTSDLLSSVLVISQGSDLAELRKHVNGNTADWFMVKQLITQVFPKCRCRQVKGVEGTGDQDALSSSCAQLEPYNKCCAGHEVSMVIETLVQELDVSEECVSTLLCYLELDGWVEVLNPVLDTCTLKCYGGHRQLRALAAKVPSVAAAVARLKEKGEWVGGGKYFTVLLSYDTHASHVYAHIHTCIRTYAHTCMVHTYTPRCGGT